MPATQNGIAGWASGETALPIFCNHTKGVVTSEVTMSVPYDKAGATRLRKAKPSELILIALDDLARAERRKNFIINMSKWFQPINIESNETNADKCTVCLAGSVMAGTLAVPPNVELSLRCKWSGEVRPEDVNGPSITRILEALNIARGGCFKHYLQALGRRVPKDWNTPTTNPADWWTEYPEINIPEYSADRRGFKRGMRKFAAELAARGL